MHTLQEEIFGPVQVILKYKTLDEVCTRAVLQASSSVAECSNLPILMHCMEQRWRVQTLCLTS